MKCAVWFWAEGGAGARVALRIAERLGEAFGAPSVAVLFHSRNVLLPLAEAAGHPAYTVGGPAGHRAKLALLLAAPWRAFQFLVTLLRHRPRVIIIPMNFALACPLALIPRVLGVKLIYLAHDAEPHAGDFAPTWQRYTQRWLIARSSRVLAMSDAVGARLRELYPSLSPDRLGVLPLHKLAPALRRQGRSNPDGPLRFLFLGRLIHYKGLDILAQALSVLSGRDDWRLTIAGDGPLNRDVRTWFGQMPQVDLTHLRVFEEREIEAFLDSHDIMLCPQRDASQSAAVVEALYSAMPSVVTPSGGLAEQIGYGKAGWVTAAISAEALAETLVTCLDSRESYAEISAATAAFAEAQLSQNDWPEIIAKALTPSDDALPEPRPSVRR